MSAPPTRFCVQAKDRFVVRVVKVTERFVQRPGTPIPSQPLAVSRPLRVSLKDPVEMCHYQNLMLQPPTNGVYVFVGFQAQLPAIGGEYVARSTSADQINVLQGKALLGRRKFGKGIRLCFSCPLWGNSLKVEDFYTGPVSERLEAWEAGSGCPGLLPPILQALNNTVELLITHIKQDGFLTVKPETDYIFYPYSPIQMFECGFNIAHRTQSCSSDPADTKRTEGSTVPCSPCRGPPLLVNNPLAGSSSAVDGHQQRSLQTSQPMQNALLQPVLCNDRPSSAYGSLNGASGTSNRLPAAVPTPVGYFSGLQTPDFNTRVASETENPGSPTQQNFFFGSDHVFPGFLPVFSPDARNSNVFPASISLQQSTHDSPMTSTCYLAGDRSRMSQSFVAPSSNSMATASSCSAPPATYPGPPPTTSYPGPPPPTSYPGPPPPTSYPGPPPQTSYQGPPPAISHQGPPPSTSYQGPPPSTSYPEPPLATPLHAAFQVYPQTAAPLEMNVPSTVSQSLSATEEALNILIQDIATRIRLNPHLPLVVMPPVGPGSTHSIFQPTSPDVLFIGLPGSMNQRHDVVERPRLIVSSGPTCAFVVSSRPTADSQYRYTVMSPPQGVSLGISADGEVFYFNPSIGQK